MADRPISTRAAAERAFERFYSWVQELHKTEKALGRQISVFTATELREAFIAGYVTSAEKLDKGSEV